MSYKSKAPTKNHMWQTARSFSLRKTLQNLQAYKISTGQITSNDIALLTEKYNFDPEKLKGASIDSQLGELTRVITKGSEYNTYYTKKCTKRKHKDVETKEMSLHPKSKILLTEEKIEELRKEQHENLSEKSIHKETENKEEEMQNEEAIEEEQQSKENEENENEEEEEEDDDEVIEYSKDAPFAVPGEPTCVVCGKSGQYINDITNDSVCSIECKKENIKQFEQDKKEEEEKKKKINQNPELKENEILVDSDDIKGDKLYLPDTDTNHWNRKKNRYMQRNTALDCRICWKCGLPGHLPNDCTSTMNIPIQSLSDPSKFIVKTDLDQNKCIYTKEQRELYHKCKKIQSNVNNYECVKCANKSNIVYCLDCDRVYCDSNFHLINHLYENPNHKRLYSFKLQREIKCCKSTCKVDNIYKLLACEECMEKNFERFYSMFNATWDRRGIKYIPNAICCDEHFQWHRMNCSNPCSEENGYILSKEKLKNHYDKNQSVFNAGLNNKGTGQWRDKGMSRAKIERGVLYTI